MKALTRVAGLEVTTATDHGRLEPASMCGYLLKVAGADALLLEADAVARRRATKPDSRAQVGGELLDVERTPGEDGL